MEGLGTTRLEAFSDAVIAIAITLLILEVKVPETAPGESLWSALGGQWPSYAAYATSFATIGIMWVNHHRLVDQVARVDRVFLYLNLFLLGVIGTLPFTTALLAEYVDRGAAGRPAAVVYAASYAAAGVGFCTLWRHLQTHPSLFADPEAGAVRARVALRRSAPGPLLYGVAAAGAAVAPPVSLILCGVLAVYFAAT